ncbi:MAG: flagellar motor switch protein FliG [Bryobacteraceae bacterium]|jgi:flagellar motor switch protein FliG
MTPTAEQVQDFPAVQTGKRKQGPEERPQATSGDLTKAAIFLVSVGNETSSKILRQLSEEEVELVSREVARLGPVSSEQAHTVMEEFERGYLAHSYMLQGGVDYAKKMLTEAFGSDTGLSIVERLLKSMGANSGDLVALQKSDPGQLAKLIYNEHPQVIALVLSHLIPAKSSALLIALPPELRAEVVKRMALLDQFSPETVDRIAGYISRRLQALGEFSRESYGGVRAVAEMLNRLDTGTSDELLAAIGQENETLPESIRRLMFVFEDIRKLDKEDIKILLSRIDRKDLIVALKGSDLDTYNHFAQAMSTRAQEMLTEDIEGLGPVKIKDVEHAQHQIIALVRQLQAEGAIGAHGAGDKYIM